MRAVLALGLFVAFCASANAAKVITTNSTRANVRAAQPVGVPESYAVPGWTEEQTRDWMNSYHGGTD